MHKTPITVAYGDGIGPEIMQATLQILSAAGAAIEPEVIEVGEAVYLRGEKAGIAPEAWDSLRRTRVFLKAPITTPQGGGYKSLNVTTRKALGLFANVRPCVAFAPFVATRHPSMDVVIIRENEEDLYAGIEHRQTDEVFQCLKLISRPGCERIVRYAFEYALTHGRRKVSCFVKDNIMKMTDGLFHQVFDEVAAEYPELEHETWIVDIGAAKLADTPELFDVIVMPNLYGDILSDVAAQIAGSVGMAGSANIGEHCAMFEAIHGSAPRRAGQNMANPSGLLQGAIQMLLHIGQGEVATRIQNAWLRTLEEGLHTYDIFDPASSRQQLGTREFAEAVIARLGQRPEILTPVEYPEDSRITLPRLERPAPAQKTLVGVDVFIHQRCAPNALGEQLSALGDACLAVQVITNRGVKVWPHGFSETTCVDHWRCRFMSPVAGTTLHYRDVLALQERLDQAGLAIIKSENLYLFDGAPGYSAVHG